MALPRPCNSSHKNRLSMQHTTLSFLHIQISPRLGRVIQHHLATRDPRLHLHRVVLRGLLNAEGERLRGMRGQRVVLVQPPRLFVALEVIPHREVREAQAAQKFLVRATRGLEKHAICLHLVDRRALLPQAIKHLTHADVLRRQCDIVNRAQAGGTREPRLHDVIRAVFLLSVDLVEERGFERVWRSVARMVTGVAFVTEALV